MVMESYLSDNADQARQELLALNAFLCCQRSCSRKGWKIPGFRLQINGYYLLRKEVLIGCLNKNPRSWQNPLHIVELILTISITENIWRELFWCFALDIISMLPILNARRSWGDAHYSTVVGHMLVMWTMFNLKLGFIENLSNM